MALLGVILSYQIIGTAFEWALCGNFFLAVQDFRMGIPGMLIQWFGGYALLKAIAKKSYPKLSVTIYMIMGWCAVLFLPALIAKANALFLIFIVLGGIMYTIGVIFYSQPKHPYFHFIWHLFINLASIFHFIALIFFI